jgi:hypothetical protein
MEFLNFIFKQIIVSLLFEMIDCKYVSKEWWANYFYKENVCCEKNQMVMFDGCSIAKLSFDIFCEAVNYEKRF